MNTKLLYYDIIYSPKNQLMTPTITNKKVLVTGGAGFIGSHVVSDLIGLNNKVVVIDNLSSGKKEALHPKATFYKTDVLDKKIKLIFEKECPDIVFHFAAQPLVYRAYADPALTIETNIMGTVNVLEICKSIRTIESIIIVSSDKAYGKTETLPYTENSPLQGDHPYDVSKSAADLIATTYFKTYDLPIVITRFSNVYGPGDYNLSRAIPKIMESIIKNKEFLLRGGGTMLREYTYVKDISAGCIALAQKTGAYKGQAFNFGSNNIFNGIELVEKIQNILGAKIKYTLLHAPHNEIPKQYLDWSKAKKNLLWEPITSFEQGIKETFQWYKKLLA